MNRKHTSTFVRLFLTAMVHRENAFPSDRQKKSIEKMLIEALVKRIIPFIYRNRVWTLDDSMWPISLVEFRGLNSQLAAKLPKVHSSHHWQTICYYFDEIKREQEEQKELERRRVQLDQVRRVLEL